MSLASAQQRTDRKDVACIIAAAGMSRRMGQTKQLLPWHNKTVLGSVIDNLSAGGAAPIICVLGYRAQEIHEALHHSPATFVTNEQYRHGDMLESFQVGLHFLLESTRAQPQPSHLCGTLLALSDQPHITARTIRAVVRCAQRHPDAIVIPSFNMRRGHPIYLPYRLWLPLIELPGGSSLRTLLSAQAKDVHYVTVDDAAILRDMDTPEDYAARLSESNAPQQ